MGQPMCDRCTRIWWVRPVSRASDSSARRPAVYWSSELCARYFTYRAGDGVHFVLFDDGASLQKKLELAHRLGIRHVCAAWSEISDCVGALTGQRG